MLGVLNIGPWELLIILIIALLIFGPGKMPEVARALGKGIAELEKASSGLKRYLEEPLKEPKDKPSAETKETLSSTATGLPTSLEKIPEENKTMLS